MNVKTHGRRIPVTVSVRETNASARILRILDADTVETIRVGGPARRFAGVQRTSDLDRLDWTLSWVEDAFTASARRRAEEWIARRHTEASRESFDVIVGGLEEIVDIHIEHVDTREPSAIGMLEVQARNPVVAKIVLDQRVCTRSGGRDVVVHGHSKGVASSDHMRVARWPSRLSAAI